MESAGQIEVSRVILFSQEGTPAWFRRRTLLLWGRQRGGPGCLGSEAGPAISQQLLHFPEPRFALLKQGAVPVPASPSSQRVGLQSAVHRALRVFSGFVAKPWCPPPSCPQHTCTLDASSLTPWSSLHTCSFQAVSGSFCIVVGSATEILDWRLHWAPFIPETVGSHGRLLSRRDVVRASLWEDASGHGGGQGRLPGREATRAGRRWCTLSRSPPCLTFQQLLFVSTTAGLLHRRCPVGLQAMAMTSDVLQPLQCRGSMSLSDEELGVTESACCFWSGPLAQPAEHPAWAAAGHCWVQCFGMPGTFLEAMGHLRQGHAWGD